MSDFTRSPLSRIDTSYWVFWFCVCFFYSLFFANLCTIPLSIQFQYADPPPSFCRCFGAKRRDWYAKNHVAICDAGIRKSDVGMAVKSSLADGKLLVRDGAVDMLARAHAAKVPLLIFSAGLADVIEEVLTQVGAPVGSSTSIVSNRMRWKHAPASEPARRHPSSGDNEDESDDGRCDARTTPLPGGASYLTPAPSATQLLHSFSEPLIHMFNKNQSQVPVADQHGRPHALVLGDGLGDPAMLDGAARPPTHILRIGFLNYADPENHIAKYEKVYDIVLLGDQTMAPVNAVFEAVCA